MFVTSLVYAVLNRRMLDTACAGASGTVTVEDQRSYIKIETLSGKTPTEIHSVCVKFMVSRQWTVVQFPVGLRVFVKDLSPEKITKSQEDRKHQQMNEV